MENVKKSMVIFLIILILLVVGCGKKEVVIGGGEGSVKEAVEIAVALSAGKIVKCTTDDPDGAYVIYMKNSNFKAEQTVEGKPYYSLSLVNENEICSYTWGAGSQCVKSCNKNTQTKTDKESKINPDEYKNLNVGEEKVDERGVKTVCSVVVTADFSPPAGCADADSPDFQNSPAFKQRLEELNKAAEQQNKQVDAVSPPDNSEDSGGYY